MQSMKRLLMLTFWISSLSLHFATAQSAKIDWDTWGVPHISASNEQDLFFAQGWAEMRAHGNLLLQLYGVSRGKAAEYWGAEYESSDVFIHNLCLYQDVLSYRKRQDPHLRQIIRWFTDGLNAYAKAHPTAINADRKVVLPITPDDVNLQYLYFFAVGGRLNQVAGWQEMGSNAMAVSAQKSASGHAMLVQNPHLPWEGCYTFFENEFILNHNPVYGVQILGIPGIGIGFNEYLGWTHTSNDLTNNDLLELTLKDDGYILDGKKVDFNTRNDTIRVKQPDGKLLIKPIVCNAAIDGPVVKTGKIKALAMRVAAKDAPDGLLEWWKMANSRNFSQFETALKMMQIPFYNVIYADKQGNIFYLDNGLIPKRSYGVYDDWNQTIDGSLSKNIWQEYLSYNELPKLKNPASGWLQNANDAPWTVTLPREIDKGNYPEYIAEDEMPFRSQQSANMLMADKKISYEKLVADKLSTHVLLADRVLDALLSNINSASSPILQEAKQVLSRWDRKAESNSRGMLLFYIWAMNFSPPNDYNYAVQWDRNRPNTTPYGLRDPKRAVGLLEQAAHYVKDKFGDLGTPWGAYCRLQRNQIDLPANGALGMLGVFRVADFDPSPGKTASVVAGDSWVSIIEFGKKVKARVLLSYGNSSEPGSKHNGDQLRLFSAKQLREAWFYPEQLKGHIASTEIKSGKKFVNQHN
jgi:acyl-homoserine-lactone acylase